MKFTTFLDDDKKASTDIDARKLFAPKVYHTKREIKIYRLALVITVAILIIALVVNILCLPFLMSNKSKDETGTVKDEPIVLESITNDVKTEPNPSLIYQNPDKEPFYETMPICSTTSTFKSWMDYRKITSTSSRQWKYQQIATTDDSGFRKIDEYYMVAMAKQYGPVGTKYLISFSGGSQIYAMIGDIKGGTTCTHPDKSMLEFIVDIETLLPIIKRSGNVNKVFEGTIIEIRKVSE